MLEIIMKTNYFEYHEQLFHQIEGLAMGTNCAVSVANLYMASFIDNNLMNLTGIRIYSRYIDDISFIFKGTRLELENIINLANSLHQKITFTNVISKTELDVLDVTIYPKNDRIHFKTFQKSMNKYLYLPAFSNHPPATIKGFIKGELIRYSRTNTELSKELLTRKSFYQRLLNRGYSRNYLSPIFIENNPRYLRLYHNSHKSTTNPTDDNSSILILPYSRSPKINKVKSFINNTDLLPDPINKATVVWSTFPSLEKILLKSRLSINQSTYLKNLGLNII
jgi:hypothetical protein